MKNAQLHPVIRKGGKLLPKRHPHMQIHVPLFFHAEGRTSRTFRLSHQYDRYKAIVTLYIMTFINHVCICFAMIFLDVFFRILVYCHYNCFLNVQIISKVELLKLTNFQNGKYINTSFRNT